MLYGEEYHLNNLDYVSTILGIAPKHFETLIFFFLMETVKQSISKRSERKCFPLCTDNFYHLVRIFRVLKKVGKSFKKLCLGEC